MLLDENVNSIVIGGKEKRFTTDWQTWAHNDVSGASIKVIRYLMFKN